MYIYIYITRSWWELSHVSPEMLLYLINFTAILSQAGQRAAYEPPNPTLLRHGGGWDHGFTMVYLGVLFVVWGDGLAENQPFGESMFNRKSAIWGVYV